MNTRRNETIGCNLVNGRGSRDEHWGGGRRPLQPSYITTKLRRIPNGLLGSNQRFPRPSSFLPFFHIYVTVAPVPGYFPPCFERGSRKWNRSKSDYTTRRRRRHRSKRGRGDGFHPSNLALSFALENYFHRERSDI